MKMGELAVKFQRTEECVAILSKLPDDKETVELIRRCLSKALLQVKDLKESDIDMVCMSLFLVASVY